MTGFFRAFVLRNIEALPLVVFLVLIKTSPPDTMEAWALPYYVSTLLAALCMPMTYVLKTTPGLGYIGINGYFALGAFGQIFMITSLNLWLGLMQASAMLLCVMVICISTYIGSMLFTQFKTQAQKKTNLNHTLYLSIASGAAFLLAYQFREHFVFGQIIPFVLFFSIQGISDSRRQTATAS